MCGIVGISLRKEYHLDSNQLRRLKFLFQAMLEAARERGSAATGVFSSSYDYLLKKNRIRKLRAPLPSTEFVKTSPYKTFAEDINNNLYFIVGHTRSASAGSARNNLNNHPHERGRIIGVHNGYIRNESDIWAVLNAKAESTCDSEAAIALINHKLNAHPGSSVANAIHRANQGLEGAVALALVDKNDPTNLHVVRDNLTPMYMTFWEYSRAIIFASTKEILEAGLQDQNIPGSKIIKLEAHDVYTFPSLLEDYGSTKFRIKLDAAGQTKKDRIVKEEDMELYESTQGKEVKKEG